MLRFRPRISADRLRSHCVLAKSGLSYSSRQVIQLSRFNRPTGPPLVSSLGSLFPTLRSQCSQNIYSFQLSWDSSTYYRGVQPSGQFCKKSFYLFPHSKAFLRGLRQNVHKIFTISGFCEIPPLTTEAFNPPDSFAKSPSTCFLTQRSFFAPRRKKFTKYLHL